MPFLHHHGFVHRQVAKLTDLLSELEGRGGIQAEDRWFEPEELKTIREALQEGARREANAPAGAFFARDPFVSLVQSALHEHVVRQHGADAIEHDDEELGQAYTDADLLGWGVKIGLSLIWRFLHGSHPFNDSPATGRLGDHARFVLVSDWGTGADAATKVIAHAKQHVEESEHPAHLIHLGDTYYSGTPFEAQHHILDLWPVTAERADEVGSWALWATTTCTRGARLFETTLGDPRFARQRTNGRSTSWFHLQSDHWDVVGLDSAYRNPIADLEGGDLFLFGRLGYLHGSQAQYVNDLRAAADRRLLFSATTSSSARTTRISKENEIDEARTDA